MSKDIRDHVMSFGFKVREDDIGPPKCRFRIQTAPDGKIDKYGMQSTFIGSLV